MVSEAECQMQILRETVEKEGMQGDWMSNPLHPGPAAVRSGVGFFTPLPPQPLSLSPSPHSKSPSLQLIFNAPTHSFGTQVCIFLPSGVLTNQVELPRWRQGYLTPESFFLKQSKKQMALQFTRITLGRKFKMH